MSIAVIGGILRVNTYQVPKTPMSGETLITDQLWVRDGGKGSNQSIAIAKQGEEVTLLGAVGKDSDGDNCLSSLDCHGIDTSHVIRKDEITGKKVILKNDSGGSTSVMFPGATGALTPDDLPTLYKALEGKKYLLLQFEIPMDLIVPLLRHCKEEGIITVVNPSPIVQGFNLDYLKYIDYMVLNEIELFFIDPELNQQYDEREICRKIVDHGCKNVVLTFNQKDSYFYNGKEFVTIESDGVNRKEYLFSIDFFVGAFTAGIAQGKTPVEAIKEADEALKILKEQRNFHELND